jgi:hypothetical protein
MAGRLPRVVDVQPAELLVSATALPQAVVTALNQTTFRTVDSISRELGLRNFPQGGNGLQRKNAAPDHNQPGRSISFR